MKKLVMSLLGMGLFVATACADNDIPVQVKQLPEAAQHFVGKYFKDVQVSYAKMDGGISKSYDVVFVNGSKVEFDGKGQWTDIETPQGVVPEELVPKQVADYVAANHPGQHIVKLDRDGGAWDAKLENGLELKFNKKFKLVEMDD